MRLHHAIFKGGSQYTYVVDVNRQFNEIMGQAFPDPEEAETHAVFHSIIDRSLQGHENFNKATSYIMDLREKEQLHANHPALKAYRALAAEHSNDVRSTLGIIKFGYTFKKLFQTKTGFTCGDCGEHTELPAKWLEHLKKGSQF